VGGGGGHRQNVWGGDDSGGKKLLKLPILGNVNVVKKYKEGRDLKTRLGKHGDEGRRKVIGGKQEGNEGSTTNNRN